MQDAILRGTRVCVPSQLYDDMVRMHPDANMVYMNNASLFESFYMGYEEYQCEAAIYALQGVTRDLEKAADVCVLGLFACELLHEIPIAFPVKSELAMALSGYITRLHEETPFESFDTFSVKTCAAVTRTLQVQASRQAHLTAHRRLGTGGRSGARTSGALQVSDGDFSSYTASLEWTDRGQMFASDLERLNVKHLAAAFLLVVPFMTLAVARALYDDRKATRRQVKEPLDRVCSSGQTVISSAGSALTVDGVRAQEERGHRGGTLGFRKVLRKIKSQRSHGSAPSAPQDWL